jgi:hypothetical protein
VYIVYSGVHKGKSSRFSTCSWLGFFNNFVSSLLAFAN